MRRSLILILAIVVVGLGLVGVTAAHAATDGVTISRTHNHITCTWRTELGGAALCGRADGTGDIVVVSQTIVMVKSAKAKILFVRNQPNHSRGFGPLHDTRITATETHNKVTCHWSALDGGAAGCNKASRHGFVGLISRRHVFVSTEASKLVFTGNQP
jgi:hypothetical protein